jgi:hypothetical protein
MIELDEARSRIDPLQNMLVDSCEAAVGTWATFVTDHSEMALPLDATARANFIHSHLRHEVDLRVADLDGVEPTEGLNFFGLIIQQDTFLRFKYVGKGVPHNVPTKRQKLLANQTFTKSMKATLMGDPSMPPPTMLTCGYTLDGIELGRIEIRRDCKGHQPWSFDIHGGAAVAEPLVFPGMTDTTRPATVTSTKKAAEKGQADAGGA